MKAKLFIFSFFLIIVLTGCEVNKITHNTQSPLNDNTTNEEIITITPQDRESINSWVAVYKKSYDTAFETIDKDWNYEDPAAVWLAQKDLGFNTVINPLTVSENGELLGLNLIQVPIIAKSDYPNGNLTVEQFSNLYSMHIPMLNQFINVINQYYPERAPRSEIKKHGSGHFGSKVNFAVATELKKNAPLLASQINGLNSDPSNNFLRRITNIVEKGGPAMIYEFEPIGIDGKHTSYISEIKNINDKNETLASGQIKLKVITYKSIDDSHIKKTTSYIDFLNITGDKDYQFLDSYLKAQPELLYFGPVNSYSSDKKLDITNKRNNPDQ